MAVVITIKQEPPTERNLTGKVTGYSFDIGLDPGFSPYPQQIKHITKKTLVDKILDGYALLRTSTTTYQTDIWTQRRIGELVSNTEQFGVEPWSDRDKVDKRLYDKIREELERLKTEGYQFEIKDETRYSPERT